MEQCGQMISFPNLSASGLTFINAGLDQYRVFGGLNHHRHAFRDLLSLRDLLPLQYGCCGDRPRNW